MFYAKPDKVSTTDLSQQKSAASDTSRNITANLESKATETGKETTKRETRILPDGTTLVSEDIVRDFLYEHTEKQNFVLSEQVKTLQTENTELHSKVEEMKKPKVHITLFPSYSWVKKDFVVTFAVQKRIFWDCYLGVSIDVERVGLPLTCGF